VTLNQTEYEKAKVQYLVVYSTEDAFVIVTGSDDWAKKGKKMYSTFRIVSRYTGRRLKY
jgi:hypothetical protein